MLEFITGYTITSIATQSDEFEGSSGYPATLSLRDPSGSNYYIEDGFR